MSTATERASPARATERGWRILLVDDHLLVREGLRRILESSGEPWVVTEASSGFHALDRLRQESFDLVSIDLSMPGLSGLELTRRIKAEFPHLPILVLSMHAEEGYALRAFQAGAGGYLTKDAAPAELLSAMRKVATGGTYVTPSLAERVVRQLNGTVDVAPHSRLSDRELDILRRMVRGQRLTDIAHGLNLSIKTVSTHKSRIQEKLKLPGTAALIRYGMDHRLHLGPDDVDVEPLPADAPATTGTSRS
jgi:DNA-binding NarL/FixJ family response regulator